MSETPPFTEELEKCIEDSGRLGSRVLRLEERLKKYGRHLASCNLGYQTPPFRCTCGFAEPIPPPKETHG